MLNLNVNSFMLEFTDGTVKNVGPTNKSVAAKLFDVETVSAREFGDSQLKVVATDASGNEVQIALFPEQAEALLGDIRSLREEGKGAE